MYSEPLKESCHADDYCALSAIESVQILKSLFGCSVPYAWQEELLGKLISSQAPEQIGLPTAAGKTFGVLRCWLAALVTNPKSTPRRLVYVVNRRAVADQVYEDAMGLSELVKTIPSVSEALAQIRGSQAENPLPVYAFRGQRPIDQAWQCKPTEPAILVGTPEMLGSRLLFRAYVGSGNWRRAQAAGLLGQDAWWVLDEPHLAQPFWSLLCGVRDTQAALSTFRPFWVTSMGATNREKSAAHHDSSIHSDPVLGPRLRCLKPLIVHSDEYESDAFVKKAVDLVQAWLSGGGTTSIGVIVSTVRLAKQIHSKLAKELSTSGVALYGITGAMRGYERDDILASPQFLAAFQSGSRPRPASAVLVGTHCLEAGFDGDFDMLLSDIPSIPSLIQRNGRLNRIGAAHGAEGVFCAVKSKEGYNAEVAKKSHQWLLAASADGRLSGSFFEADGPSIQRLWMEADPLTKAALSEAPAATLDFDRETALLFACSSLLEGASKSRTDLFLKGLEPQDQSEVHFLWRLEASFFADAVELQTALRLRPPLPVEMAQLSSGAAREFLSTIAKRLSMSPEVWKKCWLIQLGGESISPLFTLEKGKLQPAQNIAGGMVIFPPEAGGYDLAFLQAESAEPVGDVRSLCTNLASSPEVKVWNGSGFAEPDAASSVQPPSEESEYEDSIPSEMCLGELSRPFFEKTGWAVFNRRLSGPNQFGQEVTLEQHTEDVRKIAKELAERLYLPSDMVALVEAAATIHDSGKAHHGFQRFLGNQNPENPIAKSSRKSGGRSPFRHEALSVLNAASDHELTRFLVGTHHGHGRPLFKADHLPPRAGAASLAAADGQWIADFSRLNTKFSPWAIAWLESLLKSADAAASAASEGKEEL
jgi:CRISPR-associated endonuclease/helicase Cas3